MKATHHPLNSNASVLVTWTRPMLDRFKKEFEQAKERGADTFLFDDNGYTVGYAYYLIQYLEGEMG